MEYREDTLSPVNSLATETGERATQREKFPERLARYGKAKYLSDRMCEYIRLFQPDTPQNAKLAVALRDCGNYLVFRDYYTVGEIRLHKACFCRKHLLCPLCAIRRGSKQVQTKMGQVRSIVAERADLGLSMVTLTVKDGPDLSERFSHLLRSMKEFMKRRHRKRGSSQALKIEGAVWSYEFKRGKNSGEWHPHVHMIVLTSKANQIDQAELSSEWHSLTGDSYIVDVRPIRAETEDEMVKGFCEVFKYAVKFSDQSPEDTWHCFQILKGRRLVGSCGLLYGIPEPEILTDEPLDDLPYIEYFYRYLKGRYQTPSHEVAAS